MKNHPHLRSIYELYLLETQPFRKVHRMIDLFESLIKTHTAVILSEYVKHNRFSDAAKGLLAHGLRTPSLGTWQRFSRELFIELQSNNYTWHFASMPDEFMVSDNQLYGMLKNRDLVGIDEQRRNRLMQERKQRKSSFDDIIALRHKYAHGATPSDIECDGNIQEYEPFLKQVLAFSWLESSVLEERNGKILIRSNDRELSLHPILVYKSEEPKPSIAFFNDLKDEKVGHLNYPIAKHYPREKKFYDEFTQHIPLKEWKKSGSNEFCQHVEELTETFKGRSQERETFIRFVREKHKGYLSIQGNPGIGKSALIAQFINDLRASKDSNDVLVVEYFIRRSSAIQSKAEYLFNYLIRRTDELFAPGKSIKAEGNGVWDLQQQLFAKWRLWGEQREKHKLLYLIDGLDEGTENEIANYMPAENFNGVLIVYGSRPGGHKSIDNLWAKLSPEYHTKIELTGLRKEDIRALVYEVANKYELERESAWVDKVLERSQGNPLYLKLLCDAIENGSIALNDIDALPVRIYDYYKAILDRYAADHLDGTALLAALFSFAAARDYISMAHVGIVNQLDHAALQRVGSTLKEILIENPLTEQILDYQLFHESFREYLMWEKSREVSDAAERFIDFCGQWKKHEGTWEQRYALQHYAAHAAASKRRPRTSELLSLLGNREFIETQKSVLKQFDATRELFRLCLNKASSVKEIDPQLEAALKLVDLKYEEANDAPHVVGLVANGNPNDFDLALNRIDSFGGADQEGVFRRFLLYMLCLMELTLLEGKNKPFRKAAIEKLLNHLDEQIPPDPSIINWNDFFSSYTMFLMACEWADLGLDYLIVYKRTDDWEIDWLSEKGPYSDLQFEVLQDCARGISSDRAKSRALRAISTELAKQGKVEESASAMQEALTCAMDISEDWEKSQELSDISTELIKQGKVEVALTCARGIDFDLAKSSALRAISSELAKQGKVEESASALQESLSCARGISDKSYKSSALWAISTELVKQGKVEEALSCARGIDDDFKKSRALAAISTELSEQGKFDEATSAMQEALTCARGISHYWVKGIALSAISSELIKQGKVEEAATVNQEALTSERGISDDYRKSRALAAISTELAKQGKIEEALTSAKGISDDRGERSQVLSAISTELAKQGKIEEALTCARSISEVRGKRSQVLSAISAELAKQGKVEEAVTVMQEMLTRARHTSFVQAKGIALSAISAELEKQGKVEEAATVMQEVLICTRGLHSNRAKSIALSAISTELAKRGKVEEALSCARGFSDDYWKSSALSAISTEMFKQSKIEEAASAMQEALTIAKGIGDDRIKSYTLQAISTELAKQGKVVEAQTIAKGIGDDQRTSETLKAISTELAKQGKIVEALTIAKGIGDPEKCGLLAFISIELVKQGKVEEAYSCAKDIRSTSEWNSMLREISTELAKQGRVEEALSCARDISFDRYKIYALSAISTELAKQGKVEDAASAMQDALTCTTDLDYWNSSKLKDITTELAKQGKWTQAEETGMKILHMSERQECWKRIATNAFKERGWQLALGQAKKWQSEEPRLFYLKGWSESLGVNEATADCLEEALSYLQDDTDSIEQLLFKHVVHEMLDGDFDRQKIYRLNKLNESLNMQWAFDIANEFLSSNTTQHRST